MYFLEQNNLIDDHLYPFNDFIRNISSRNNFILNQVMIWSILKYVPLRQFKLDDIRVIFYEDVYMHPNEEISRLLSSDTEIISQNLDERTISQPSRYSRSSSNIKNSVSPVNSWKNKLTVRQIHGGIEILEKFGLDKLYGQTSMPNSQTLSEIMVAE